MYSVKGSIFSPTPQSSHSLVRPVDDLSPTKNCLSVGHEDVLLGHLGEYISLLMVSTNILDGDTLIGDIISKVLVHGVDVSCSRSKLVNSCHLQSG